MYSDGSRPENPSTCSKAGTSLQSDNEEHEVLWLGMAGMLHRSKNLLRLFIWSKGDREGERHQKKNIPKGRKEGSHFHRDQTENLTPKSSLGLENPLKMTQLIQLDVKFDLNSRDLPQSFVCFVWQSIQVTPD